MKSSILSAAVEAACRERVLSGKYPTCVLHLTMPYDTVDVNVHPNKLEVRFQNEAAVAEAVEAIVADALADKAPVEQPEVLRLTPEPPPTVPVTVVRQPVTASETAQPEAAVRSVVPPKAEKKPTVGTETPQKAAIPAKDPPIPTPSAPPEKPSEPPKPALNDAIPAWKQPLVMRSPSALAQHYNAEPAAPPANLLKPTASLVSPIPVQQTILPNEQTNMRMIGTLFDSYILVEYADNLMLIDQQAVHERVMFDRMMKALDQHRCGQEMLVPMIVSLTRREQQLLDEHARELADIGLVVEPFGENEVSIRSIPMILGQPQAAGLLRDIIDQLENERGVVSLEKRRAAILALACKRSVRSGERLNDADIRELVSRVADKRVIPASPRGTPLVVALNKTDIDRRFRRMQ